jgi:SOS-response transcriptional repressor LexA
MIDAGILDGDYVIIRRQETVEEGEIAAVLVNGEGTLKRWHHRIPEEAPEEKADRGNRGAFPGGALPKEVTTQETTQETARETAQETVRLVAANERFAPIEITADDRKEVMVIGKYVGLVRGELRSIN